jgi:hypothetical protein
MLSPTGSTQNTHRGHAVEDNRTEDRRLEDSVAEDNKLLKSPASHTVTQALTIKPVSSSRYPLTKVNIWDKYFCSS